MQSSDVCNASFTEKTGLKHKWDYSVYSGAKPLEVEQAKQQVMNPQLHKKEQTFQTEVEAMDVAK